MSESHSDDMIFGGVMGVLEDVAYLLLYICGCGYEVTLLRPTELIQAPIDISGDGVALRVQRYHGAYSSIARL